MNVIGSPGEHVRLTDRLAVVQWLRVFLATVVFVLGFVDGDPREVVPLVAAYLALTAGVELVRRRAPGLTHPTMSWMLLLDGLFLALAIEPGRRAGRGARPPCGAPARRNARRGAADRKRELSGTGNVRRRGPTPSLHGDRDR